MLNEQKNALAIYRLNKSKVFISDAKKTLALGMYDTAANRSYYAMLHAMRAVLALEGWDSKKHQGVIAHFQQYYIKTGIFDKNLSNIIKSAFSLRTDSDYEDFFVISKEEVIRQVQDADYFYNTIREFLSDKIK